MKTLSRADLLRVLNTQQALSLELDVNQLASLFHFDYDLNRLAPVLEHDPDIQETDTSKENPRTSVIYTAPPQQFYWYVAECQPKRAKKAADSLMALPGDAEDKQSKKDTSIQPLPSYSLLSAGQWQNLWDQYLTKQTRGQLINIPLAVRQIAQTQPIRQLPKAMSKHWKQSVVLILDRCKPLRPVWPDMREAWLSLLALMGEEQLETFYLADGPKGNWSRPGIKPNGAPDSLPHDSCIILIGAFGALKTGKMSADWSMLIDQLEQRGHTILLLSVCRIENLKVTCHLLDPRPEQQLDKLLSALSLAWKPSLNQLRHLRRVFEDSSLRDELDAYNHPDVEQLGGQLNLKQQRLIESLSVVENLHQYEQLKRCAKSWQSSLCPTAREIERLQVNLLKAVKIKDFQLLQSLACKTEKTLNAKEEINLAYNLSRSILPVITLFAAQTPDPDWDSLLQVFQKLALLEDQPLPLQHHGLQSRGPLRWLRQLDQQLILDETQTQGLLQLGDQAYCVQTKKIINQSLITRYKTLEIRDQGLSWQLKTMTQPDWSERIWQDQNGLFASHCQNALFFLQAATAENSLAQWQCSYNPWSWASSTGIDEWGLWAEIQVKQAVYRLRWIKPGQFMMGSPEQEDGRFDNEIQHGVRLNQGFWLGETSCTQAFWQAVMEKKPVKNKLDLQLPVVSISWHDCQTFIARLKVLFPDFSAQLPTEAQWEYACRAGTTTAYWWGKELNSEYANNVNKLRTEAAYPANAFGLKSMSGNVLEWCSDWYGDYSNSQATDPVGPDKGRDRVLRGGRWFFSGRNLRSAYRYAYGPDDRYDSIGFRLAGGIDPQASEQSFTANRGPWNGQAIGNKGLREFNKTGEKK